jgi:hypothetical protein
MSIQWCCVAQCMTGNVISGTLVGTSKKQVQQLSGDVQSITSFSGGISVLVSQSHAPLPRDTPPSAMGDELMMCACAMLGPGQGRVQGAGRWISISSPNC